MAKACREMEFVVMATTDDKGGVAFACALSQQFGADPKGKRPKQSDITKEKAPEEVSRGRLSKLRLGC